MNIHLTPTDNKTTWSTWPTSTTQYTYVHENKVNVFAKTKAASGRKYLNKWEVWTSDRILIDISILEQPWQTVNNGAVLYRGNNNDHYFRLILGLQNMLTSPTQTISDTNHSTTEKNSNNIPNSTKACSFHFFLKTFLKLWYVDFISFFFLFKSKQNKTLMVSIIEMNAVKFTGLNKYIWDEYSLNIIHK